MSGRRLLYFVTEDWAFCSHRLALGIAAKDAGYEVWVVTRVREHGERIAAAGLHVVPLEMARRGMNPIRELKVIITLISIYRRIRPHIVHHVALKPMIYGSIAAWVAKVPVVINAVIGLGYLFSSESFKARLGRWLVIPLYRLLLNRPCSHVILQNPDDLRLLHSLRVLFTDKLTLIRGSGVDDKIFTLSPELKAEHDVLIVLASRLLWDKGIGEFIAAARMLIDNGVSARFALVGDRDPENPASISENQLHRWQEEGIIELWGRRENMAEVLSLAHIVCLPSYREGLPKVLLEAAAVGRPIVTTDAPGCREIVEHGKNGYLVPLRDSGAVADALKKLIDSPELRRRMGKVGRKMVEEQFSLKLVNAAILSLYKELIQSAVNGDYGKTAF